MVVRPVDRGSATMLDDLRHFLERQRLFGVLLMPPISENDSVAKLCADIGCRYVRMGSAPLDKPENMVTSNDRQAVREATEHLIANGHRRIGLVAGPHGFRSALERRLGFEDALGDAGIALPRSMIADGNYTFDSGLVAAERLLDLMPRPTAILSCNDEMAAGVIHAARQRGLEIPRDLSIIGFDDTPIAAHVWPPLTTVRWPIASMARSAALKLIAGIDGDERDDGVEEPSLFLSTLIRRGSVSTANG
jgi:LacI family transcriptional regulator